MDAVVTLRRGFELFGWWHEADLRARRAFMAASLGWMLDSFDVMLLRAGARLAHRDPTCISR